MAFLVIQLQEKGISQIIFRISLKQSQFMLAFSFLKNCHFHQQRLHTFPVFIVTVDQQGLHLGPAPTVR